VTDGRRPPHDRFKGNRKREAQWLQPGRNQVVDLNRNKEADPRESFGIALWLDSHRIRRVVVIVVMMIEITGVVIALVVVEIVPAQVRVNSGHRVMPVVMIIRVHMYQRRAQRANRNGESKRDREEPAVHCLHFSGISGSGL